MAKYSKEEEAFLKQIGERIRYFRYKINLSQEKLATFANLHPTYISSVERGERNIAVINLQKIAKALKISLTELVDLEKE
ncbi:MAG: helix-turn-helix domain-containing protein [Tannerellaceae bacterium]|nr:helix-turn-helix domain-containing protein [Tannerellaceae bacterium]